MAFAPESNNHHGDGVDVVTANNENLIIDYILFYFNIDYKEDKNTSKAQHAPPDFREITSGSEHKIASTIPSDTLVGDSEAQGESGSGEVVVDKGKGKQVAFEEIEAYKTEGDKIDYLIDLDDVFRDDWESEDENIDIEFEKDDEGIKYATHEGFEFDASFIN
ncbi:hypothetical protein L1987_01638 [Smallanthus sonchifolius]|uniref:Uncharacterized protein n=1 Tax=Smallanthus sonchifolius TaxID=185202 RepID=A0ACB9K5S0_9ASTR|nr:hypothetical protein L1987_01638 [Smallanthus sonchifolius]